MQGETSLKKILNLIQFSPEKLIFSCSFSPKLILETTKEWGCLSNRQIAHGVHN